MNHSIIEVNFKVRADLRRGEEVRVSGNIPALGCNKPERAVPLYTSKANSSLWETKSSLFVPGESGVVKYRYCIFSGGKFSRWEYEDDSIYRIIQRSGKDDMKVNTSDNLYEDPLLMHSHPITPTRKSTIITKSIESHNTKAKMLQAWSKQSNIDYSLKSDDTVILVSFFLPVILNKLGNGSWEAKWDEESILSLNLSSTARWVGTVRYKNSPIPKEDEYAVSQVLFKLNCFPIFLTQDVHHNFYEIFLKQNIWLAMHLISDVYGPIDVNDFGAKSQQNLWHNYLNVHNVFRNKIIEVYHEGDIIWIHGFHLMCLPNTIRRKLSNAKIGYFFHTPFPSSDIFRTITHRDDLLRGILSADHIGFHLFEYAQHFISCCNRILGYSSDINESGVQTINVDGREVALSCIHIGVDNDRVQRDLHDDGFVQEVNFWLAKFPNKILVSGIDRLERLKGIPLKLRAIDRFLSENPNYVTQISFLLIGITANERGNDYHRTLADVKHMVNELNQKYGQSDLIYFEERVESSLSMKNRLALFAASDILMIIPPRDGLNRLPLEFTLAKDRAHQLHQEGLLLGHESKGLIILSEFISSARVMRGALIVSPWKTDEVKNAIKHALEMSANESSDRVRRNLEFSTRLTTISWANQVLSDIKQVERSENTEQYGFGTRVRVMGVKAGFEPLDTIEICKSYRQANYRLILLDWGGTLVTEQAKNDNIHAYAAAQNSHYIAHDDNTELRHTLEALCNDPKNIVFIISGKEKRAVEEFFYEYPLNLGLGAEHGCYYRHPFLTSVIKNVAKQQQQPQGEFMTSTSTAAARLEQSKWHTMMKIHNNTWKDSVKSVMELYTKRTHGSYIERKENALIWQFRDTDPEFGLLQSKELEAHLKELLTNEPVEVIRGGGLSDRYLEIRPAGISKGEFLNHIYHSLVSSQKFPVDFVLAIGDDSSDEPMFETITNLLSNAGMRLAGYGVTVGKKPTSAQSFLDDSSAVFELLKSFLRINDRFSSRGFYSTLDLTKHDQTTMTNTIANKTEFPHSRSISAANFTSFDDSKSGKRKVGFSAQASPQPIDSILNTSPQPAITESRPQGLYRSSSHLSMSQYMKTLSQDSGDDDEDGVFF